MPTELKRVLVYRLGSLGDTVVALPALHLIARAFPDAERRMLTNFPVSVKAPAAAAILADNGLIHGYFRYTAGTRSLRNLFTLWQASSVGAPRRSSILPRRVASEPHVATHDSSAPAASFTRSASP